MISESEARDFASRSARIPVGELVLECDGVCTVHLRAGLIERNEVYFDPSELIAALGQ